MTVKERLRIATMARCMIDFITSSESALIFYDDSTKYDGPDSTLSVG